MILNEDFKLTPSNISTFRFTPKKVMLEKGIQLHRFYTSDDNKFGAFWLSDQTLMSIKQFANSRNAKISEVARPWMAIRKEWNPQMNNLIHARLLEPVYAFVGPTRYQSTIDNGNVLFMGNSEQIFLPNLVEGKHITQLGWELSLIHI